MTESKIKTAVALGSFDGLHKGHKAVLACALSCKERGLVPIALLFDSHPLLTLTGKAPDEILQPEIRSEMLTDMGFLIKYISFADIHNLSPEEFFDEILIKKLNAGAVCCGSNYHFGKMGKGNADILKNLCEKNDILFLESPDISLGNELISSSRIRQAIKEGNIPLANEMLGYEFRYRNLVTHGYERGRELGFPTINQYFDEGFIIPKNGVYASVAVINGCEFPAVTNIGLRPSFEDEDIKSETNIHGYSEDLYNKIVEIRLIKYLREEQKFASLNSLSEQIKADTEKSLEIFSKRGVHRV
jgi:riboflavin kinase / FMN adenylyltransferase